jgi:uncharacterized protein YndB with AHSA1/START domain
MRKTQVVLLCLAGVGVAAALVRMAGRRTLTAELTASVEVDRPRAEVFGWLSDRGKLTRWASSVVEIRAETPGPRTVGSRELWVFGDPKQSARVEIPGEVTELEENRRISSRIALAGAFESTTTFTLTDLAGGRTRVEDVVRFNYYPWTAKQVQQRMARYGEKEMQADLGRLKALVEAGTPASPP